MSIAEKLQQIAENEQKVFDAGKQAEYDAFWDVYQENGNRTNYNQGFKTWKIECFNPKYDLILEGRNEQLFYNFTSVGAEPYNITEKLQQLGRILDTSKATAVNSMFGYYKGNHIPYLDFSSAVTEGSGSALSAAQTVFSYASNVVTIEGIKLNESVNLYRSFSRCDALKNITFEGTIANDISFADCKKLSLESLQSIVHALKDCYHQEDEWTHTITISKASKDKLDEEMASGGWDYALRYIEDKAWNLEVL